MTPRAKAKLAAKRLAAAEAHAAEEFAAYIRDVQDRRGLSWITDRLAVTRQAVWCWGKGTVRVSAKIVEELMQLEDGK